MYHDPLTDYVVDQAFGAFGKTVRIDEKPKSIFDLQKELKNIEAEIAALEQELALLSPQANLDKSEVERAGMAMRASDIENMLMSMRKAKQGKEIEINKRKQALGKLIPSAGRSKAAKMAFYLLGATAMAVSYSRNKSLLKSFGAGFISVPYLIYVAIDMRKKK